MRARRWTLPAGLALVALAAAAAAAAGIWLVVSGDGAASQADYERSVVAARDRVDAALVRITRSPSVDELLKRLEHAADEADVAADEIEDTGAAAGFGEETDRLVSTLHAFAGELDGTAQTLSDPTFAQSASSITSLSFKQWDVLNAVLGTLKRRGIDVEPLARH